MCKRLSYFLDINSLNTHCNLVFSKYSATHIMINGLFQKKKNRHTFLNPAGIFRSPPSLEIPDKTKLHLLEETQQNCFTALRNFKA